VYWWNMQTYHRGQNTLTHAAKAKAKYAGMAKYG